jgi:site-specific recombinase XerD
MKEQEEVSASKSSAERRTLKVHEWPAADRLAWEAACKPSHRLTKGGSASHLAPVSQEDVARRYGLFLGFLRLNGSLNPDAGAAAHVTPANVEAYTVDLAVRVTSVTAWNCIYKLRRAAQLIAPDKDFSWLREIEKDLAFVMEPKSKLGRFVAPERSLQAGLALHEEAKTFADADFKRARGIRNGLMLALLTLCPSRRKNFATLEIGKTFKQVRGTWWIIIPASKTKSKQRPEERPVATWLNPYIELYLTEARPILLGGAEQETQMLWISSKTHKPMTVRKLGSLISQLTKETLGIPISPHLFRTAAATTLAEAKSDMPHLASALLGHAHPPTTEEHYNRASSLNVATAYAEIIRNNYNFDSEDEVI